MLIEKNIHEDFVKVQSILEKNKDSWIETETKGSGSIGRSFENLLGVKENNLDMPDFGTLEIKSHRTKTDSLITLFSKSPTNKNKVGKVLLKKYGNTTDKRRLYTTVYANKFRKVYDRYDFKLKLNRIDKRIELLVYKNGIKEALEAYWDFDIIEKKLKNKLNSVCYVTFKTKKINEKEYFKYNEMTLLIGPELDIFLNAIEEGFVCVDFRYSGTKDHGVSFRIRKTNLDRIFKTAIKV